MAGQDRIEREIAIDAPLARVWEIVGTPGWWIGDGDRSLQTRRREGDLEVIEDPKYGRFPIKTVASEPQRYVSYRFVQFPGEEPRAENSTLVEFWLSEREGGTVVRVVESGFELLRTGQWSIEDNTKGWAFQMDVLKRSAEAVSA